MKKNPAMMFFILFVLITINVQSKVLEFKDIIDYSVNGDIKADRAFGIKFKEKIETDLDRMKFYDIYPSVELTVIQKPENIITFEPQKYLEPGCGYTLEIRLDKLFPSRKFKENTYRVRFHTKNRRIWFRQKKFVKKNENEDSFSLVIDFDSGVPLEGLDLREDDIKLFDYNNKKVIGDVEKVYVHENKITVHTGDIINNDDKIKEFSLLFDKDRFSLKNDYYYHFIIPAYKRFSVNKVYPADSDGSNRITIEFNRKLRKDQYSSFISLEPKENFRTSLNNNKLVLTGDFTPGESYTVKVSGMIESESGEELGENIEKVVRFNDTRPQMSFKDDGIYLPLGNKKVVQFKTVNIARVRLQIDLLYENNLTYFLYENSLKNENKYFYGMHKYGKTLIEKDFSIKAEKNVWRHNEIDISEYIEDRKGVLYKVRLDFSDSREKMSMVSDYSYGQIEKLMVPTDLGLCVKKTKGSSYVFVFDMDSKVPAKDVKVNLYDSKNQLLDWGITDEDGLYISKEKDLFYATAESDDGDFSFIKHSDDLLEYSSFDLVNKVQKDEKRVYIFTDRDVYRPGDDINIGMIFRNEYGSFPSDFPISIEITDPMNRTVDEKVLKRSKDGFYFYFFKTSQIAPTGIWNLSIDTGLHKYRHKLRIETIIPSKIEVNIKNIDRIVNKGEKIDIFVDCSYLTGKVANDLKSQVEVDLTSYRPDFKGFSNYLFYDQSDRPFKLKLNNVELLNETKEGYKYGLVIPNELNTDLPVKANILASVFEDNGRAVKDSISPDIAGKGLFSGILKPDVNYLKANEKYTSSVIVLDRDGRPVKGEKIGYRIYRHRRYWWWHHSKKEDFRRNFVSSENTILIKEGEIISDSRPVKLDISPEYWGEYKVEIFSPENRFYSSACFFSAVSWGGNISDRDSFYLTLTSKKDDYEVGEYAQIVYEAPLDGKALLTLEAQGRIFQKRWVAVKKGKNEIGFEVTKDMFPNIYVFISFISESDDDNLPARIFGIKELRVRDRERILNYTIDCPSKVRPDEEVKIRISTREKIQSQLVVNIADEGLLLITDYDSPDPYYFFYKDRELGVETSDIFNRFIRKTKRRSGESYSVGGGRKADLREKNINRLAAQRFTPVQISSGIIKTDNNGDAVFRFTMPDYEGSVRVSIAGARGIRYGRKKKNIRVIRDITILTGMPRFLYTGDEVIIPLRLINNTKKNSEIRINPTSANGSEIRLEDDIKRLSAGEERLLNLRLYASDRELDEDVTIEVLSEGKVIRRRFDLKIIDPTPFMMIKEYFTLNKGEEFDFSKFSDKDGHVEISTVAGLDFYSNYKSLLRFPYGCLEQTVSRAITQLFIDNSYFKDKKVQEEASENVKAAIRRINDFQNSSGRFSYWPGGRSSRYWDFANLYAGLFLSLAKRKGYFVPGSLYNSWLESEIQNARDQKGRLFNRLFRLYILSYEGVDVLGEANYIMQKEKQGLDIEKALLLASVYNNLGQKEVVDSLISENLHGIESFSVEKLQTLDLRELALVLELYTELGYREKAFEIVRRIAQIQKGRRFTSTLEKSFVIKSVFRYLKSIEDEVVEFTLFSNSTENKKVMNDKMFKLNLKDEKDFDVIKNTGDESLYIGLYTEAKRRINKQEENGLRVRREFRNRDGSQIDESDLISGQEFYMTVRIENISGRYIKDVFLQQKIPAGWEFQMDSYQEDDKRVKRSSLYEYRDKRDDSITWFFDISENDKKFFTILLRSVNEGSYTFPGAFSQAMYDTEYFFRGMDTRVKVRK